MIRFCKILFRPSLQDVAGKHADNSQVGMCRQVSMCIATCSKAEAQHRQHRYTDLHVGMVGRYLHLGLLALMAMVIGRARSRLDTASCALILAERLTDGLRTEFLRFLEGQDAPTRLSGDFSYLYMLLVYLQVHDSHILCTATIT